MANRSGALPGPGRWEHVCWDDDGLGAAFRQFVRGLAHVGFAQRDDYVALHVGALGDAARTGNRHLYSRTQDSDAPFPI